MSVFYLDSSAWVKRYEREAGTDWIERFWRGNPLVACSHLGLLEVISAVVRRHAGARVAEDVTRRTVQAIGADFEDFCCLEVTEDVLALARELVANHRLRAADAVHLASALHLAEVAATDVVMIHSDTELLRAARAESLPVIDPQDTSMPPDSEA